MGHRFLAIASAWIPKYSMSNPRLKADRTRCGRDQITLEKCQTTARTILGATRYWLVCPDCGFETGPFTTVDKALNWELGRGCVGEPSLAYQIMCAMEDDGDAGEEAGD